MQELIHACKNRNIYINPNDIYSDILFLEEQGFITAIKADNAPVLAVKITSSGVNEIENTSFQENWKNISDIQIKLSHLYNEKDQLIGRDITSEQGRQWLADVSALIGKVDVSKQEYFDSLAHKVILPLTDLTRIPIWNILLLTIQQIISVLTTINDRNPEKVYPAGRDYDFYRDFKQIMQSAKTSIMIVDPYVDEDLFDLYVSKLLPHLSIRLLIKQPKLSFKKVIEKFAKQYGAAFNCNYSTEIHDRVIIIDQFECFVIGQSIKDAAIKKPTYMTRVYSIDMAKLYDDIWNRGTNVI